MRIVNRNIFLSMPKGTIYAKIPEQWIIEDICVKYETTDYNDWYYMSFNWVDADNSNEAVDRLEDMINNGTSYPVQNSIVRDGLFENDAHFLIYEQEDVKFITSKMKGKL
jgi:hypothetical protein